MLSVTLHLVLLASLNPFLQDTLGNRDILLVSILVPTPSKPQNLPLLPDTGMPAISKTPALPTELSEAGIPREQSTTVSNPPDTADTVRTPLQPAVNAPARGAEETEQTLLLPAQPSPANWTEIEYETTGKSIGITSGQITRRYEVDSLGHYRLQSKSLNSPSDTPWALENEGLVTEGGLRPLVVYPASNDKPDFSSGLYQFMFSPPGGADNRLWGNDGLRLSGHTYRIVGMETLEVLSQGELRTVHLLLDPENPGEKWEVWLAVDYRYLPVRIRSTDASGKVSEQLAKSFSLE